MTLPAVQPGPPAPLNETLRAPVRPPPPSGTAPERRVKVAASRSAAMPARKGVDKAVPAPRAVQMNAGRHAVMLFHGLTSTPLELLYIARGLSQAGFTVRLPVIENYSHGLPGAGPNDHTAWMHAALAEFDAMRAEYDSVAVGGLCIGALLALKVAALRPQAVSALLGMSTTLYFDGWASPWSRILLPLVRFAPFAGRIAIVEGEPFGVKDERLRAWIAAQMRESGGSNAGAAKLRVRDLYEAQRLATSARRTLPLVVAPTLVIHAVEDEAASPRSAHEVAERVSTPPDRVKKVLLNDSYHMISIDQEKHVVLSELREFLSALGHATAIQTEGNPRPHRASDALRSHHYVHA